MKHRMAGKVVGGVLGLVMGGPAAALVGFVLGHIHDTSPARVYSRQKQSSSSHQNDALFPRSFSDSLQQATFTIGVIVLGAKMAKADGRVSREEIAAFRRVFHFANASTAEISRIFDQARQTTSGYEPYAARLAQVFRRHPAVLEEVLTGLFFVAIADQTGLSMPKVVFLRRVATIFGFTETDFFRIAARSGVRLPGQTQAVKRDESFAVLGLPETASNQDIKRTYRVLIRKHHPDKLASQGLPPELMAQATEKMKRINAAYATICKARGIK